MRRIIVAYILVLVITNIRGMEIEYVDAHQENNTMVIEVASDNSGGPKRLREERIDIFAETHPFFVEDIFYNILIHLNFKDRVTALGATCSTLRDWTISEITEFSDQFEYDLIDIPPYVFLKEKIYIPLLDQFTGRV
ncbi:MAG: hypothetical protein ACOH2E_08910 [Candidatus Paracaedibacter sp.]